MEICQKAEVKTPWCFSLHLTTGCFTSIGFKIRLKLWTLFCLPLHSALLYVWAHSGLSKCSTETVFFRQKCFKI